MFTGLLEPEVPPTTFGNAACDDSLGLLPQESGWWGGTAIVTGVAGAAPSLHVALLYNGVTAPTSRDHSVRLTLSLPEKNQTIIDEVTYFYKYNLNVCYLLIVIIVELI